MSINSQTRLLMQDFGLPFFDLEAVALEKIPRHLINEALINKHGILPFAQRGKILYLALTNPTNTLAIDEIKFFTGLTPLCILVDERKLTKLIQQVVNLKNYSAINQLEENNLQDAPIVRYVEQIIFDAIKKQASDIHFEPYEENLRIRFRIDGLLHEITHVPKNLFSQLTTRLKIMADLDIAERRLPQDGRFKMTHEETQTMDFRVSTCPTITGEKIVLRLLESKRSILSVEQLGLNLQQQNLFLTALSKPQGMILVTGPTGSGKTLTLYTALSLLNKPHVNILTVEDPVEIHFPGINQVSINPKAGLSFATALRAFLRQDPDIIMLGEIRDLETAEIAIKAAQTGHLVLSTLHTNSAAEAITRLNNMGIARYNLSSCLTLILAQRLARKLCLACKISQSLPDQTLQTEGLTDSIFYQAKGCDQCSRGYKGRIGIFELMPVTESLQNIIMQNHSSLEIFQQAKLLGMQTLRESAINCLQQGVTSLLEINRVTKDES